MSGDAPAAVCCVVTSSSPQFTADAHCAAKRYWARESAAIRVGTYCQPAADRRRPRFYVVPGSAATASLRIMPQRVESRDASQWDRPRRIAVVQAAALETPAPDIPPGTPAESPPQDNPPDIPPGGPAEYPSDSPGPDIPPDSPVESPPPAD